MNVGNSLSSKLGLSIEKYNAAILLFDEVEVLDFAGPFEVFSRTRLSPGVESRRSDQTAPFRVFTVAKKDAPVIATGELQVVPGYSFQTAPPIDLLVVPGGYGTRALLSDKEMLDWIRGTAATAKKLTSVCTGSCYLLKPGCSIVSAQRPIGRRWISCSKSVTSDGLAFQSSATSVSSTTALSRQPEFPLASIWHCTWFSRFVEPQSPPKQRTIWNTKDSHAAECLIKKKWPDNTGPVVVF